MVTTADSREEEAAIALKEKRARKEAKKEKKEKKEKKKKKKRSRSEEIDVSVPSPAPASSPSIADGSPPFQKSKKQRTISTGSACCSYDTTTHHHSSRPIVESSALPEGAVVDLEQFSVSLLLFYQYVEPPWSEGFYKNNALPEVEQVAATAGVCGRMRVAREGLNCTLTGTPDQLGAFCAALRCWNAVFDQTEFKITHHLTSRDSFSGLKVIPVRELVHYGLEGDKAPPIQKYSGLHLEPREYHEKLAEKNTVVIDVRNHYEAVIGRFHPPGGGKEGAFIDPLMRKSTEFPAWLDSEDTKQKLRGKQVLMYCTGGIRCERASALLKYKMETDPATKELGIQGVYQLQGGIDKYFKQFPDGGYWKGKNYTFDKRFAHAPVEHEGESSKPAATEPLGKCEACLKPWDKYRGKRRCPTCGVPSLICRDCFQADVNGTRKLDRSIRCDLCVEQGIHSKRSLREKEQQEIEEYENRQRARGLLMHPPLNPNPEGVTRLFLKNMCRKNMSDEVLMEFLPGITHIVWRTDRKTGTFFGQGWVELESVEAAALAVAKSGEKVLGRPIFIDYQAPDGKDLWPPPKSAVK